MGATVHYLNGFHEHGPNGSPGDFVNHIHYVKQTWFFDVQGSYSLNFVAPVETSPVPGYAKDSKETASTKDGVPIESATAQTASYGLPTWKRILNGTTVTLGCNNVFRSRSARREHRHQLPRVRLRLDGSLCLHQSDEEVLVAPGLERQSTARRGSTATADKNIFSQPTAKRRSPRPYSASILCGTRCVPTRDF